MAKGKTSDALLCQMDLLASVANMLNQQIPAEEAIDSKPLWNTFLGRDPKGRPYLVEHAGSLAVIKENWKYIEPSNASAYNKPTNIELGNAPEAQLYDLSKDLGEQHNVAQQYPEKVKELAAVLAKEQSLSK